MTRCSFWSVVFGALALVPAFSHPHVWVDARVELTVSSGVVSGLEVEMTFGDVFSGLILQDTAPGALSLTPKAIEAIRTSYFQDLAYFGYFIHLSQGKKSLPVPEPQRFTAVLKDGGRIQYRFFLPLSLRLSAGAPLSLGVYDDSYYVDVQPVTKNPVTLVRTGTGKVSYEWADSPGTFQVRVAGNP